MATTNKRFTEGTILTTSAATYYTCGANTVAIIKKVTVTNYGAAAAKFTLYLVVSAGAAGNLNTVTSAKVIAPGATYEAFEAENHVLQAGDFIQALSDTATTLAIDISGIEVQ
jgi:hypothetical protein